MSDPVSWLQIEQGWRVVGSDGTTAGRVAQVEGDKNAGIFDGLAVESEELGQIRYVPSEQVGAIVWWLRRRHAATPDAGQASPDAGQAPPAAE